MDFTNDAKYDNIFLDIIQSVDKLPNFLDVIFGFLRRRTDLYHVLSSEQQNSGFFPGCAEKMIIKAFQKHKDIFECNMPSSITAAPKVIKEVTLQKSVPEPIKNVKKDDSVTPDAYVQDADCYNGAVRDNYSWSQTIDEIDIRVNIPISVRSSKDVKVQVEKKYLRVSVKLKEDESFVTTLEGKLSWDVRSSEHIWSYDPKESKVLIVLEKVQERWWDAFFEGEEVIDTRAIDCSRPMSDLDNEAQASIHKLMYDNQQKQLGLPTSEEQRVNDVLRAAWNVEGSPFKGQQYDPASIDIVGDSAVM